MKVIEKGTAYRSYNKLTKQSKTDNKTNTDENDVCKNSCAQKADYDIERHQHAMPSVYENLNV